MPDRLASPSSKVLRPYQKYAIDAVAASMAQGNRRVVLRLPTGAGKTLIAATIIKRALEKGHDVVCTAPKIALIDQTIEAFEAEGITNVGAMQANHPRTNPLARVQIATLQTLARRSIPEAALIVVDECHERSQVIDDLMDSRPDIFFIGLSATPWSKGLGLRWDDLIQPVSISQLIDDGFLSQFRVYAPDVPDLSNVAVCQGDYVTAQLERVMSGTGIVANVPQTWLKLGDDRPTFCFAVNRAHAAILTEQFERLGIATAYVDMNTDRVEMAILESRFRAGEVRIVCSVIKMTTGIDWPVSCVIDAAPTKSEIRHVQKIGRGLRINPGTEDLIVLDHAGNALRLGLVTDIDHASLDRTDPGSRQPARKTEKLPIPCPRCAVLMSGPVCLNCGHERKRFAGIEVEDGELVEIAGDLVPADGRQAFFSMAIHLAAERGYKPSWADMKFKEKFRCWPDGLLSVPIEPDRAFLNWEQSRRIAYAKAKRGNKK